MVQRGPPKEKSVGKVVFFLTGTHSTLPDVFFSPPVENSEGAVAGGSRQA